MEVIVGGKASGKTHRLLEMAIDHQDTGGRAMVLMSTSIEAHAAFDMACKILEEKGVDKSEAIRRAKVMITTSPPQVRAMQTKVFVDNVDWILARYLGAIPEAVSMCGPACSPQGKVFDISIQNSYVDESARGGGSQS